MSTPSTTLYRRKSGTTTALFAATTNQIIDLGTAMANKKILVYSVAVTHEAGAAATFTARLFETSAAAAEDIEQRYAGSSTVVASQSHDSDIGAIVKLDPEGKFYLTPGPNAGADNQFKYVIEYHELRPTEDNE